MRRLSVMFICLTIIFMSLSLVACDNISEKDIIRIHIRANSNDEYDQQIKYLVKDEIVSYINNLTISISCKDEMYNMLNANISELELVANEVLQSKDIDYQSEVKLVKENFPIRSYDGVTLPAGEYDSLIINLGTGDGDNWWCVAFPPLCFIGAEDNGDDYFTYKSKLLEILNKR